MNKEEMAKRLNGREIGSETTIEDLDYADGYGLVIIYGRSDDCVEIEGAISDEVSCYGGITMYFDINGLFKSKCKNHDCAYANTLRRKCKTVKAVWCGENKPAWSYETDIPHSTFDIFENGELFCIGIVFELSALRQ